MWSLHIQPFNFLIEDSFGIYHIIVCIIYYLHTKKKIHLGAKASCRLKWDADLTKEGGTQHDPPSNSQGTRRSIIKQVSPKVIIHFLLELYIGCIKKYLLVHVKASMPCQKKRDGFKSI